MDAAEFLIGFFLHFKTHLNEIIFSVYFIDKFDDFVQNQIIYYLLLLN